MDRKPAFAPFSFTAPLFATSAANPFLPASEPTAEAGPVHASDAIWSQDIGDDDEGAPAPETIDVRVVWGTNVLHFEQMCPPRAFTLGDEGSDFTMPELASLESMGRSCPLVVLHGDHASVFVAPAATAEVTLMNGTVMSLDECLVKGTAQRSTDVRGACEITLPHGATATVRLLGSELAFEVTRTRARQQPESSFWASADLSGQIYTGLSALAHASLIGALAFFLPAMQSEDAESIDRNSAAAMRPYLEAIAEKEPEHVDTVSENTSPSSGGGDHGSQAAGPSGAMGSTVSANTAPARYAIRGEDPNPKLAHDLALAEAAEFGMLGLMNTDASSANMPVAPWADVAAGHDASNANGGIWAENVGDMFGPGLVLSGTGDGGGGKSHGIGMDGIGSTVGGGWGNCTGGNCTGMGPGHGFGPGGIGSGHQPGEGGHVTKAPIMRTPGVEVNGTIPAEVVQRIIRANFGRFRLCYEAGLRQNPGLTGRVAVDFVIDRTGQVAAAKADSSTDMPDADVVACVVRGFHNLNFPEPKNGLVKVMYPLLLAPGG